MALGILGAELRTRIWRLPRVQASGVWALVVVLASGSLSASDLTEGVLAKLAAGDYSRRGADTCLACHDDDGFATLAVFQNHHGDPSTPGSPFSSGQDFPAGLQCEACHGPVGATANRRWQRVRYVSR